MIMDDGYWDSLLRDVEQHATPAKPVAGQDEFSCLSESERAPDGGWWRGPSSDGEEDETDWAEAQKLLEEGSPIDLLITGYNRGGLLSDFGRIQGFLPASHLVSPPAAQAPEPRMMSLSARVGETITVRVIEIDRDRRRLILSERCARQDGSVEQVLASLSPGQACRGVVTNLCAFGAFVDLGGFEGLIHISELSWGRVNTPDEVVCPGSEVDVLVLDINPTAQKVALSLKRLRPDPWQGVEERYFPGQVVEATITNVVNFGAFARLEEGLEGLVHISELAEGSFMHPRNVVNEGDRVRVRVLHVDGSKHRLALSMRCSDAVARNRPVYSEESQGGYTEL